MATLLPSTLQLTKPNPAFPSSARTTPPSKLPAPPRSIPEDDTSAASTTPEAPPADKDEDFENRLSQVRFRYRSGTGKKAEIRKARKGKKSGSSSGSSVFLPPVALKEPASDGLKVEFGFSPYSERVNGRIAILGLSALFLVELATGRGVINYHSPAIVFIQVYFVAAVSGLYVKYEKEKISVWPQSEN
ncbi:FKBP-type peptidyl-prolyl cis-trans isomerase [Striga asiatica]|uniref:FKBP-type peptidyl-prolyl cis-trans isomerase n=1 Tax=Striga asiatica TaxID=4170 RepID=A0A5A7PH99_STRAF|nr:FKBP-type peptidyl-prolyl cis-trans isomerase [Striga asiatica]